MLSAGTAHALPGSPALGHAITAGNAPTIQNIHSRRGGYGYGYGRNRGRNIGLGIAAGIIGGVVISQAARSNGYYERRHSGSSARQRCADTYRSFDWSSGTYMGYDGDRHVCPYL